MSVRLYVEGGGDSKDLQARCREAFSKLIERASLRGRMPRITACGGRRSAYEDFCVALRTATTDTYAVLLVDSETPVTSDRWTHILNRDQWPRPATAADDQLQLMVVCMETWLLADPAALRRVFASCLREGALLPSNNLEGRTRDEVNSALITATVDCGHTRMYAKGRRSFQVLKELDPQRLTGCLPHFQRFISELDRHSH